jgi:hypothetical protein
VIGALAVLGSILPGSLMHSRWFAVLTTFVAVNTVLYLTLAVIKILPKAYVSDWIDRRNRRAETRSIYPEVDGQPST